MTTIMNREKSNLEPATGLNKCNRLPELRMSFEEITVENNIMQLLKNRRAKKRHLKTHTGE